MRLRSFTALILALVMVPLLNGAGSDWQNLAKIRQEDRVQVVDQQLRSYTGKFVSFSEEGIILLTDKEVTIAKADVYRVTVVSRGRGRHVLRGLLIGSGIGLGIGAAASAPSSVKGSRGDVIAAGTILGAGIGSLVGVAKAPQIPIYRAARIRRK
jgi:hypothetical protein